MISAWPPLLVSVTWQAVRAAPRASGTTSEGPAIFNFAEQERDVNAGPKRLYGCAAGRRGALDHCTCGARVYG